MKIARKTALAGALPRLALLLAGGVAWRRQAASQVALGDLETRVGEVKASSVCLCQLQHERGCAARKLARGRALVDLRGYRQTPDPAREVIQAKISGAQPLKRRAATGIGKLSGVIQETGATGVEYRRFQRSASGGGSFFPASVRGRDAGRLTKLAGQLEGLAIRFKV
jgi:hypothetical protein